MAYDWPGAYVEALRVVALLQTRRIEPFFQSPGLAGVAEGMAIPQAAQGGQFLEACPAASLERQCGVGADGGAHDVVGLAQVIGDFEAAHRVELVVGIERRGVADWAALGGEDLLTAAGVLVEGVGVGRRFEGLDIERQRVELLVAIAGALFAAEGLGPGGGLEVPVVGERIQPWLTMA